MPTFEYFRPSGNYQARVFYQYDDFWLLIALIKGVTKAKVPAPVAKTRPDRLY
ncbi:hypothetical protein SMB34_15790 [Thalassospira permensis NBRC 106175]|uniref:Uncharacterized protein n=1 Tax=Thalassospira permensis NBRC 106175 TaxID=1353532 RepID=A0ABR4TQX3_9PROT|nr:hypothetical protein SMB34_15790 [Thalassospira permensis NBRC 106175]